MTESISPFLRAHKFEGYLVVVGLSLLFFAGRAAFLAKGEDPDSPDRGERALAAYGKWVTPALILGLALVAVGLAVLAVRLLLQR